jgi:branched-chain amino acid transport system permease protein
VDLFSQLLANGIINGSSYAALGLGFGLIIGVTGRFHFAYGTTYAIAAYAAIGAHDHGIPLLPAIVVGIAAGAALGVVIEWLIYRPLEGASPTLALLSIFVSALGIVIVGENVIRLWLGSRSQILDPGFTVKGLSIGNTTFTSLDVVTVAVMWTAILVTAAMIRYTRPGRMIDAVRVNPEMARVVGIDSGHVYLAVFAIGSAIAGGAAILGTMKYAAVPDMGNQPVFIAFVVAFLAGVGSSPLRTAIAGLAIGIIESMSGLWLSSQWSQLVVFSILFIYVAIQPIPIKAMLSTRARRAPVLGAQS